MATRYNTTQSPSPDLTRLSQFEKQQTWLYGAAWALTQTKMLLDHEIQQHMLLALGEDMLLHATQTRQDDSRWPHENEMLRTPVTPPPSLAGKGAKGYAAPPDAPTASLRHLASKQERAARKRHQQHRRSGKGSTCMGPKKEVLLTSVAPPPGTGMTVSAAAPDASTVPLCHLASKRGSGKSNTSTRSSKTSTRSSSPMFLEVSPWGMDEYQ